MADEIAVKLAEAVKDAINAWSWSQEFTAARVLKSEHELEDIGTTLQVEVSPFGRINAPPGRTIGKVGREKAIRYIAVDVIIQQRVAVDDKNATDPLVNLTDEIADYFDTGGGKSITVSGAQVRVCDGPETWTADGDKFKVGVFASMVRLPLEVIR